LKSTNQTNSKTSIAINKDLRGITGLNWTATNQYAQNQIAIRSDNSSPQAIATSRSNSKVVSPI